MTWSRWTMTDWIGRVIVFGSVMLAAQYVVRFLDRFDAEVLFAASILVMAAALLAYALLGRAPALPAAEPHPAPDEPAHPLPYAVTEAEWLRAKRLYRGVHDAAGMARRIAWAMLWVLLLYLLFAAINYALRGGPFFRLPATAILALVAVPAVFVVYSIIWDAPQQAASTFRSRGAYWWPATLAWNADAVFIHNGEGYRRYALGDCLAWKEDDALFILFTRDKRYWCLPKRALAAAGRLMSFEQLLQQHVAKISPYKTIYRWR